MGTIKKKSKLTNKDNAVPNTILRWGLIVTGTSNFEELVKGEDYIVIKTDEGCLAIDVEGHGKPMILVDSNDNCTEASGHVKINKNYNKLIAYHTGGKL